MGPIPMSARKITKVEISKLFWKDLAKARNNPDYWTIRKQIGEMVSKAAAGEPGGDNPFSGKRFSGIRHMHVAAKLIVFTTYPDDDTMRICALKKHDFYGFKRERKGMAEKAAQKIWNASNSPAVRSPGWGSIKWSDPGEIPGHPELPECSSETLNALYQEVLDEIDSLEKLDAQISGMSNRTGQRVAESWIESLIEAQEAVEMQILKQARRKPDALPVAEFERWAISPN